MKKIKKGDTVYWFIGGIATFVRCSTVTDVILDEDGDKCIREAHRVLVGVVESAANRLLQFEKEYNL
jgi:hypothetical protein